MKEKTVTRAQADNIVQSITNTIDAKLVRAFGAKVPFTLVMLPKMDGDEIFSVSGNLAPDITIKFLDQAIDQYNHAAEEGRVNSVSYPALQ